jgi:hypothetical protein
MKTKSTVILILTLFVMMLAAGSTSAFISYLMGQQALRVVTQPEVKTDNKLRKKPLTGPHKGLQLVDEKAVLVEVYNLIHTEDDSASQNEQSQLPKSNHLVTHTIQEELESNSTILPIKNSSQGVTLELVTAKTDGSSFLLDLNLKNEGSETIRFLYSFIDVRDEQGKVISAIPEGLPGELPANGQNFRGSLKIPLALLDQSNHISLTLTDYPDQKLELKLTEIPVAR